jgi:hypothetical protein
MRLRAPWRQLALTRVFALKQSCAVSLVDVFQRLCHLPHDVVGALLYGKYAAEAQHDFAKKSVSFCDHQRL